MNFAAQNRPYISVVIPVYRASQSLHELGEKLTHVLSAMGRDYEIIMVNDGSPDHSWEVLQELVEKTANLTVINLGKNVGQHNALICGFHYAKGEIVVTMDDDLQHPPETIPELIKPLSEGWDVVLASWEDKRHGVIQNLGSHFMGWLNNRIFGNKKHLKFSAYRAIQGTVIKEVVSMTTRFPFISGMLMQVTDKIVNIEVEHHERKHGQSNYTFGSLLELSSHLLINYSSIPIRFVSFVGIGVSLFSLVIASIYLLQKSFVNEAPLGWTTIVLLISFYNSLLFLILAILGEYLARILAEVGNNRKTFSVREVIRSSK